MTECVSQSSISPLYGHLFFQASEHSVGLQLMAEVKLLDLLFFALFFVFFSLKHLFEAGFLHI